MKQVEKKMVKSFKYFWKKKKKTYLSWGAGASLFVLKQFNSALNIIVFNVKRPFGKLQRTNLLASHYRLRGVGIGGFCGNHVVFIGNRGEDQWSLTECKGGL